jgi:hypothetical protein
MDLQNYNESRAQSGYGAVLMFVDPNDTGVGTAGKYRLFIPLESVPSLEGSVDTFEFDLLNSKVKGKVQGKSSLDEKDNDFLWHRDNIMRLEKYADQVLDFMVVYADKTAKKFTGQITARPNDISNDVARGTITITPMSLEKKTIYDCRNEIIETVAFDNAIPDSVVVKGTTGTKDIVVKTDPATAVVTVLSNDTSVATASYLDGKVTVTGAKKGYTYITITASATGMASWDTTVLVEVTE